MLNDDLIELYYLVSEETKIKKDITQLKNSLTDIKDNIDEVKASISNGLTNINHKYAKYKNMIVTLVEKPEKFKLKAEELCDIIDDILNMDLDTTEKREQILKALKPKNTGKTNVVLSVKINNKEKPE